MFIATVEMVIIKNDISVFKPCQVPLPQQVAKVLERKFKALATSLSDRWAIYLFFFPPVLLRAKNLCKVLSD